MAERGIEPLQQLRVQRDGVEPPESKTPDLQSGPLPLRFNAAYFYLHKLEFDYDNWDKEVLDY